MMEPLTPDRLPGARPTVALVVTLLAGAVGICAAMTFAAGWARDLPKTIPFAVAQEPFGTRSMLDTDNARAGLDRALSHVPDGERIISLTIDEDHVGLATIDRNGQYFSSTAEITGEVEAPDLGHTLRIGTRHRSDRRHRFPSCRTGKPLSTTTQGGRRPRFMVCM